MKKNIKNRHERISHFYRSGLDLNDSGQTVLEALEFKDYYETLSWLAQEFSTKQLDWHTINAGSPYPVGLPNVVIIVENGSKMTLEDALMEIWKNLTSEEKLLVNLNYKNVFGFPSVVQGANGRYCTEKYKKWVEMSK